MNTILIALGLLSIYSGYRMFCSLSRRSLITVSGAVLAVFGVAILVGEAKAFASHGSATPRGADHRFTNWRNGSVPSHHRSPYIEFIA